MFETETVEPCLVWKLKIKVMGVGGMAPWSPSGYAPGRVV